MLTWTVILLSHHRMRQGMRADGERPGGFPLPLWPIPTYVALAFMGAVVVILGFSASGRTALVVGAVWIVLLLVAYRLWVPAAGRERIELETHR